VENQQITQEEQALEAALAGEPEVSQESSESEPAPETAPEEETAPATVEAINAEEGSEQPGEPAQTESPVDGTPAPDVERETPVTGDSEAGESDGTACGTSAQSAVTAGEPASDGLETKLEDIKPALALPAIVSGRFRYIEEQLATRIRLNNQWRNMSNPGLNDSDSWTEYQKDYKEYSKQYRHASGNADNHTKVLCLALRNIQIDVPGLDVGNYIENAYLKTPMYEALTDSQPVTYSGNVTTTSKPKDLEGQLKLELKGKAKDDGSTAEPAGECTTISGEQAQEIIQSLDAAERSVFHVPEIDKEKLTGYFLDYHQISEEHDDLAVRVAMKAVLSAALDLGYTPEMLKTTIMNSKNDESFYGLSNTNRVLGIMANEKELKVAEAAFLAQQKAEAEAKKAKKTTAPKEAKGKKETNEKPAAKGKAKAASHADKPVSSRKTGKGKSAAGKTAGT